MAVNGAGAGGGSGGSGSAKWGVVGGGGRWIRRTRPTRCGHQQHLARFGGAIFAAIVPDDFLSRLSFSDN